MHDWELSWIIHTSKRAIEHINFQLTSRSKWTSVTLCSFESWTMRTLRVNLFIDRAWLRSCLNISLIRKGNRAHQFSTDVTFQMSICRAVQFCINNNENIFSSVHYSFVFHDIHWCERKKFGQILSLQIIVDLMSANFDIRKNLSHKDHDCWKSETAVTNYVTSVVCIRTSLPIPSTTWLVT